MNRKIDSISSIRFAWKFVWNGKTLNDLSPYLSTSSLSLSFTLVFTSPALFAYLNSTKLRRKRIARHGMAQHGTARACNTRSWPTSRWNDVDVKAVVDVVGTHAYTYYASSVCTTLSTVLAIRQRARALPGECVSAGKAVEYSVGTILLQARDRTR